MRYGDHVAVDGLDLAVEAGRTLALLGPNGAGKTTTVETCVGLRRPHAGRVRVLGRDPVADGSFVRPRLGVMLQEQGVYPQARPREVLATQAALFTDPLDVDDLLDRTGLDGSLGTRFRDLSGGQQQRLALALALVGRPEVAFLDEPTAGLDPAARRSTWELVDGLAHDGVAVVLTTHLLDEAEVLADDVVIIDRGRVVAAGTPSDLARSDDTVFTTDRVVDTAALTARLGVDVRDRGHLDHRIAAPPSPGLVAALAAALAEADVTLTSLNAGRRGLEEVFLRLTGGTGLVDEQERR
ncbi:ABC transporter ATP-binding protein [Salsipaludibacter albus]|uniref:ABC transporter ATP-binding protein n=1 Tax=Salsipaludibacter albus TaxID=2849650 RepID=UPI001EE3A865|nr:ABC transporter ATP-binding protein [Salsipaludibacter albus]MBY5161807.1 ABC transporter ATP-binding protein [Salsipaludibacter albus]